MTTTKKPWYQRVWFLRFIYLGGAILALPAMGVVIEIVSYLTGLTAWSESHGPYFILNEYTGPGVMANFVVILIFIGICMAFIFKAFSIAEEIPLD